MRAIVVDDSRAMRTIIGRMLKESGFQVLEAGNGQEAVDVLKAQGPVELALVDWNMPVMNGLELVRAVRARPEWNATRLMMVTTEVEVQNVAAALESGANEYLMKPFTPDALKEKLALLGIGQA
ncbi:MAG TPA: response regulator [Myxococcales bacterium]|nr:response regulator [Myxococcales bacterium]